MIFTLLEESVDFELGNQSLRGNLLTTAEDLHCELEEDT